MHLPPITPHTSAPGTADTPKARQLRQAAQQFEGMLISNLWSGFQNDPMTAPDDSDPAADNIRTLGMQAMSTALSARGGLGFAALVERQLMPSSLGSGPSTAAPNEGKFALKPGGAEADKATKASSPKNVLHGDPV